MNLSRRAFLKSTAAATLAAGCVRADDPPARSMIDTHTHFYDPTRPEGVPWPGKDDKILYKKILPEDYRAIAGPLGIAGTVVVEASPWLEDNQWVLDLAAKDDFVMGLVGHLTPGGPDFAAHLKRFCANKKFRGIRINGRTLEEKLADEKYVGDLKALADQDRELDINGGPTILPAVEKLGAKLSGLRIVINHCANVKIDGKAPPAEWVANMQACAKHKQIYCKVSALVEGTGKSDGTATGDVAFYKPVLDTLWNAFGEDRLIYGSNWPVSERFAPYARVQSIVANYFKDKGQIATEKYFAENARAAYKYVTPA